MELIMLDATIVRAHACAAGYEKDSQEKQALGRSKGGFTTKIHCVCDALGLPLKFIVTPGQRNDITQASEITKEYAGIPVIGDKAYCSHAFMDELIEKDCSIVIPPRANSVNPHEYDKHVYKERHQIECFFGKIKHYRRVFSRFDKTSIAFMGFICLASTLIWLR